VIQAWRETSLVCNVDITDVILPSDAELLTLTFHVSLLYVCVLFVLSTSAIHCLEILVSKVNWPVLGGM